ncbi:GNAT family N-acetyltransferase [Avibacterium sp. 21-586]|uniref:GNAT family N-acetyltransferase n=1 Tax=Avibacterium sp. 21-586 TaxID=2911534 RepID=UPI0022451149|nr:GNAT family protein [Avibacterium sp. 21-586]MCW9709903.1 GNAT family N-acetyltransferase [Avibacterium sp. 21-586]
MRYNEFNQAIGEALQHYSAGDSPSATLLQGQFCRLEKLSVTKHGHDLFEVYSSPLHYWTYLPLDPFSDRNTFINYLTKLETSKDPYYFSIIDEQTQKAVGTFALMRIDPDNRVIEVGWITYSPILQKTKIGTEAQFLLAKYVFEKLKYRRYEWKCDSLNQASNHAAKRLGFCFEGTFRQAQVYKGRNRDTNWYSMLDYEWESKKLRFQRWLSDDNFDINGQQKVALSTME